MEITIMSNYRSTILFERQFTNKVIIPLEVKFPVRWQQVRENNQLFANNVFFC